MRVYFDTNVYRHISDSGKADVIRRRLASLRWHVIASDTNLFETYAIPNESKRMKELAIIVRVARSFEQEPQSFREAMELRNALFARRPEWKRTFVFDRFSRDMRRAHLQRWADARDGRPPNASAYAEYKRDAEVGIAQTEAFQRELRRKRLNEQQTILARRLGAGMGIVSTDLQDPELYWRAQAFIAFDGALFQRHPASRDLYDWLAPHLRLDKIAPADFFTYWMHDAESAATPRTHWAGLVGWAQLYQKVTHGNPGDLQHAMAMLDVDLFVTADANLFSALQLSQAHMPRQLAAAKLWNRSIDAESALEDVVANAM